MKPPHDFSPVTVHDRDEMRRRGHVPPLAVETGRELLAYQRRLALEQQEAERRRYMQRRYDAAAARGAIL